MWWSSESVATDSTVITDENSLSHSQTERLWRAVLADLQGQMTRATFDTWLRGTRLERVEGASYVISTPNPRAVEWLEQRLGRLIQSSLTRLTGQRGEVQYIVRGNPLAIPDRGEVGYHSASRLLEPEEGLSLEAAEDRATTPVKPDDVASGVARGDSYRTLTPSRLSPA